MGNIWKKLIHILPKGKSFQLTFFSNKKMNYEPKRKLIRIDEKCYSFSKTRTSSQDSENSEEESINEDSNSTITDIEIFPHSEGKYKHTFYVPRGLLSLVTGPKGSTKERIEIDTNTSILIPERKQDSDIVVIGSKGEEIISARHQIDILTKESRFKVRCTHFISIPMKHEHVISNFNNFKTEVLTNSGKESRGVKETLFQKEGRLHLTLDVLWLFDEDEESNAVEILNSCKTEIIQPFIEKNGPITIEAKGVTCMNKDPTKVNILYAGIVDEQGLLQELSDNIVEYFAEKGLMKKKSEKVKLHMTVMNTLFAKLKERKRKKSGRVKRETFDATNIIEAHKETNFGKVDLSIIHLSQFSVDDSGYYKSTGKVVIAES
ncbi:activating signal cointegrator 1 complex subunit 1-like [Leptopilina heterotoma]|uniref:activating signal cointegrator 1 complex subunit 1-like n=1 Tax=Leptopilina heterotoma TaxID=63436 RepID=UPI001CA86C02|nr:activating signal cointegrator 1 complex subunit 1-like [Leptopilina heterotoma]